MDAENLEMQPVDEADAKIQTLAWWTLFLQGGCSARARGVDRVLPNAMAQAQISAGLSWLEKNLPETEVNSFLDSVPGYQAYLQSIQELMYQGSGYDTSVQ